MEFSQQPVTYNREAELATMLNVARAYQKLVESSPFTSNLELIAAAAAVVATERAHAEYGRIAAAYFADRAELVVQEALHEAGLAGVEIDYY